MLKYSGNWLITLLMAAIFSPLVSGAVDINDKQSVYDLSGHLSYLEETDREFSLLDILSMNDAFEKTVGSRPNFGQVDAGYWFKVELSNSQRQKKVWLLELDFYYLDHIEFYVADELGKYKKTITGDNYPFSQRPFQYKSFIVEVPLSPGQISTVYLKIRTTTSLQVPLFLWDAKRFQEKGNNESLTFGLFYGVLLAMIFYNLFIFISTRDVSYLYYIVYIGSTVMTALAINGYAFQYLWPSSPLLANISIPILMSITLLTAGLFSRHFLKTWEFSYFSDLVLKALPVLAIGSLISISVIDRSTSLKIAIISNAFTCLVILAVSIYGTYKKQRRAYFFVAAWGVLLIGSILRNLVSFDLVPSTFLTYYSIQIGIMIEVFILSLALGDRINTDKLDKFRAVESMLRISKQQTETEKRQIYQSLHDPLTNCPNQLFCEDQLKETIHNKAIIDETVSVLCIQFNNFHDINYTLGHETGDQILISLIDRLNQQVSTWPNVIELEHINEKPKIIAKVEGVCIALFFNKQTQYSIIEVIEQISNIIHEPIAFENMLLDIDAHMGVSMSPEHGSSPKTLIRKAMVAVKAAKKTKRLSVIYSANIDNYSTKRLSLMGELKQAISNNELELFYHPKIDLSTMKMISMEALIRWNHPEQGLLGPDKFIDLAEGSGIIRPLTHWVIENAISVCDQLNKTGYDISVAVNISARNLLEEDFVDQVVQILTRAQFDPGHLTLEVVESALVEDFNQTILKLEKLKDYGVKLSIDDFGTGYSSLSYIKKLPVEELKIDRSFVGDMLKSPEDQAIIDTTITLSRKFKLNVVAEGIEDQETMNLLKDMGCDTAQGYFFTKPLNISKLNDWLVSSPWRPKRNIDR